MSIARLLHERERLEHRLQKVKDAIQLLQELDGSGARQLGAGVALEPQPPKKHGKTGQKWSPQQRKKFMAYLQRRKAGNKTLQRLNTAARPS